MKFKYPGGDVALCTGLWIVFGGFAVWSGATTGHMPWYLIVCAVFAVPAIGIWFQLRFAGYLFGGLNAALSLVATLGMFLGGAFSLKAVAQIGATIYAAASAIQWARGQDE